MKLLIDGVECGAIELEKESRATLIRLVAETAGNDERVIVFVKTPDGGKHDFNGLDIFGKLNVHDEFIDLVTATPKEIALACIYDAVVILEKVKKDLKQASEMLITGDFEKGMKKFSLTVRDIDAVLNMVDKVKAAGLVNFVEEREYVKEFTEKSFALNTILLKIEDSISLEDQVMTSDLLEYELLPVIENWQASMPSLYKDVLEGSTLH
jgi:hypothetical protein